MVVVVPAVGSVSMMIVMQVVVMVVVWWKDGKGGGGRGKTTVLVADAEFLTQSNQITCIHKLKVKYHPIILMSTFQRHFFIIIANNT